MKILAIDIGGTNIKSAIIEGNKVYNFKECSSDAKKGGPYLIERVKHVICSYSKYDAIGISTAGRVDKNIGCILYANENIPNYTGMPVKEILEDYFNVPVFVENDAKCAAYGEKTFGVGKSLSNFVCLTFGTGIGCAITSNKVISEIEDSNLADKMQHYESCASTTSLVNKAMTINAKLDSGRKVFNHAKTKQIATCIDEWSYEVAYCIETIVKYYAVSDIVLGGGVMERKDVFEIICAKVEKLGMNVNLYQAKLGNKAGLFGIAQMAIEQCAFEY